MMDCKCEDCKCVDCKCGGLNVIKFAKWAVIVGIGLIFLSYLV